MITSNPNPRESINIRLKKKVTLKKNYNLYVEG